MLTQTISLVSVSQVPHPVVDLQKNYDQVNKFERGEERVPPRSFELERGRVPKPRHVEGVDGQQLNSRMLLRDGNDVLTPNLSDVARAFFFF